MKDYKNFSHNYIKEMSVYAPTVSGLILFVTAALLIRAWLWVA